MGDKYIDITTGDLFILDERGWIFIGNLTGPTGATGATGPQGATGATGAQGEAGPRGASVLSGSFEPANTLGSPGDIYVQSTTGDLYFKNKTEWVNTGNLKGPQGPLGPPGPTGATGAQGEAGPTGPTGAQGATGAGITPEKDAEITFNSTFRQLFDSGSGQEFRSLIETNDFKPYDVDINSKFRETFPTGAKTDGDYLSWNENSQSWVNGPLPERNIVSTVLTMENCGVGFSQVGQNNKPEFVVKEDVQDPFGQNKTSQIGQKTDTQVFSIAEIVNRTIGDEYIDNPYRNFTNTGCFKMIKPSSFFGLSFSPMKPINTSITFAIFRNFPEDYKINVYDSVRDDLFSTSLDYSSVKYYKKFGKHASTLTFKVPDNAPDDLYFYDPNNINDYGKINVTPVNYTQDIIVTYDNDIGKFLFDGNDSISVTEGKTYRFNLNDSSNSGTIFQLRYVRDTMEYNDVKTKAVKNEGGGIISVGFEKLNSPYVSFGVVNNAMQIPNLSKLIPVNNDDVTIVVTYDRITNRNLFDGVAQLNITKGKTYIFDTSSDTFNSLSSTLPSIEFSTKDPLTGTQLYNPPIIDPFPTFQDFIVGLVKIEPSDSNLLNEPLNESIAVTTLGGTHNPNFSFNGKWTISYEPTSDNQRFETDDSISIFPLGDTSMNCANISIQLTDQVSGNIQDGFQEVRYS